ncbi:MAG: tyrosine recombinase [Alphaproteobacteria bacterium]|nr:tyrosine recombinase [Alphaproteobacteria bacterium]
MASAIELFLDKISAQDGVSSATLNAYERDVCQFLSFQNTSPELITADNISAFVKQMADKHFAQKTVSRKISAIRCFCKFLLEEKILKNNPLPDITLPKKEKTLPKFLSAFEIEELYQKALAHQNNAFKRAGMIIKLMFSSGLRVSEAVSLPLSAVNHNKRQITVKGKGAKERIVFIDKQTDTLLLDFVKNTRPAFLKNKQTSAFFFPSQTASSGHLTRDTFYKDIKLLAIETGISPHLVSPHVLRHSFATNLINHDADLRSVQKMLGHETITTTEIYTHITHQKIIDSVFQKHPLANSSAHEK